MDFRSTDIGLNGKGSCIKVAGGIDIRAGGADIWGKKDELMFYSAERSGDFSAVVRLKSFELSDLYAKAGLMARATLEPQSPHVIFAAFPTNAKRNKNNGGYEFQYRAETGKDSFAVYPTDFVIQPPMYPVSYPDTWLKLERKGNTFSCYSGTNGSDWKLYCQTDVPLPADVHVGLAVTAHSKKRMSLAEFDNFCVQ